MENKIVLFGAGKECRKIISLVGKENISFIYDNDSKKDGTLIDGVSVKYFDQNASIIDPVYITPTGHAGKEIREQLEKLNVNFLSSSDLKKAFWKSNIEISKYKNKYKGKRCFLVGTGPSLTYNDLEKLRLNNEFCFGANRIFKMFDETRWRPDIYVVIDYKVIVTYFKELLEVAQNYECFISDIRDTSYEREIDVEVFEKNFDKIFHLYLQDDIESAKEIEFSKSPDIYIAEGMTVIYSMIQLAHYMGFEEMYLIGVDFNYTDMSGLDKGANDHCCKNYIKPGEIVNPPRPMINLKAFESAKSFAEANGFKIYNATRGGKLEVFERVNLDCVLERK